MARPAPVTIERIERAMDEVALAIEMAGDRGVVYLPIYESLERELLDCSARQTTISSVKARLERLLAARLTKRGDSKPHNYWQGLEFVQLSLLAGRCNSF